MKTLLKLAGIVLLILVVMIFRPIMNLDMDDCIAVTGTVDRIEFHDASKDIAIGIVEDGNRYYINRGMEAGLKEAILRPKLMDTQVTIHYADHWTPLDPKGIGRHIARITIGEEIVFDKIRHKSS